MNKHRLKSRMMRFCRAMVQSGEIPSVPAQPDRTLARILEYARRRNPDANAHALSKVERVSVKNAAASQEFVEVNYAGFNGSNVEWQQMLGDLAEVAGYPCRYEVSTGPLVPLFIDLNIMSSMIHEDLLPVALEIGRLMPRIEEQKPGRTHQIAQLADALRVAHECGTPICAIWKSSLNLTGVTCGAGLVPPNVKTGSSR